MTDVALMAESDMWRAENTKKQQACEQMVSRIAALEAERDEIRNAWLRVIQAENSCDPTGEKCKSKWCGCVAEQGMLLADARKGREQ